MEKKTTREQKIEIIKAFKGFELDNENKVIRIEFRELQVLFKEKLLYNSIYYFCKREGYKTALDIRRG